MLLKDCPEEYPVTLYVNNKELMTIQLTEVNLDDWTVGFLFAEGIINSLDQLRNLSIDSYRGNIYAEVDPQACDMDQFLKRKRVLTAGCGRGVTFRSLKEVGQFKRPISTVKVSLPFIIEKMKMFVKMTPLYHKTGGMHAAAIVQPDGELLVREDIGRHNAVDKAIGAALRKGLTPADLFILTSGRISFDMCSKVAKFGMGLAVSRTAATNLAVALAMELSIDLVGYCRGKSAVIYTSGSHIIREPKEVEGMR